MTAFLETSLHAPWMLAGLAALALPPLIHLLNRRRHDVIDWGAMQFLLVSQATRRRLLLEEVLLMLLRVGLLGVLVVGLAGPFFDAPAPAGARASAPRDAVLLIDGSASMGVTDEGGRATPLDRAAAWARGYLERRADGDLVAAFLVRDRVAPLAAALTPDLDGVRERLAGLPAPAGGADWPEALRRAHAALASSQKAQREIVIIRDNQRATWADPDTLFRWELLRGEPGFGRPGAPGRPALQILDLSGGRPARVPNYALTALAAGRPVVPADREVRFRADLVVTGQAGYQPPHRVRLEIDGKPVRDLPAPGAPGPALPASGKVPLTFTHRFARPGMHRVGVIIEPDPPPGDRPAGSPVRDRMPADNRQDLVVEVVEALGVQIIDGAAGPAAGDERGAGFLRDALSPARDPRPAVRARVTPAARWSAATLLAEPRPRVVILHDVPPLSEPQVEALTAFVAAGGGLLVTLGDRAEPGWYNARLFRGAGWLPARLDGVSAEEARPDTTALSHPIFEVFARDASGAWADARFPRWMKLSVPDRQPPATTVGQVTTGTGKGPLMVERRHGAGRVIACAVPLDASWGTNLVEQPSFVPLVHETVYHLAGARWGEFNLRPGQPIRLRVPADARLDAYRLTPPDGPTLPLSDAPGAQGAYPAALARRDGAAALTCPATLTPGVYLLRPPAGEPIPFVVAADPRESDLEPCSAEDRDRVRGLIGGTDVDPDAADGEGGSAGTLVRRELWWYLLLGLIGLLVLEVWLTRRMVMNR